MNGTLEKTCCICGRVLPTKYAVAGRCEGDGCEAVFCSLHWHNGNRRCREHGWVPGGLLAPLVQTKEETFQKEKTMSDQKTMDQDAAQSADLGKQAEALPAAQKQSILKQIGEFAVRIGAGAGTLAKKLAGIRSPEEAMKAINGQLDENRQRREPLTKRYEELYRIIVVKKRDFQSAPPARKRILEMELRSAIAEYQTVERQIAAYLKNETVLVKVRGRMDELVAMSLKAVSEKDIDKLTDRIEDAANESDDIAGAIGDLDKAGVRQEAESDDLADVLSGFGDELPAEPALDPAAPASFEAPVKGADPLADF